MKVGPVDKPKPHSNREHIHTGQWMAQKCRASHGNKIATILQLTTVWYVQYDEGQHTVLTRWGGSCKQEGKDKQHSLHPSVTPRHAFGMTPTLTSTVARAVISSVWEWTDAQPIGTVPVVVANVAVVEATTLKLCKNMQRTPRVPHDITLDSAQAVYVMQYTKTLMSLHEYDTSCVLFSLQHHRCTGCASHTWPHNV